MGLAAYNGIGFMLFGVSGLLLIFLLLVRIELAERTMNCRVYYCVMYHTTLTHVVVRGARASHSRQGSTAHPEIK